MPVPEGFLVKVPILMLLDFCRKYVPASKLLSIHVDFVKAVEQPSCMAFSMLSRLFFFRVCVRVFIHQCPRPRPYYNNIEYYHVFF